MSAGESAHETARKQREKAARLNASAELWERGAQGEMEVARALDVLPAGWEVLHDLAWPGRPRANIDHVAVGPGGVFVIDAKNWSGRIEVRDQVLMQNGRRREPAVASVAEAAIAVQRVVPSSSLCMGVLCFVRTEPMVGWARDVMVTSTANLTEMLTSRPRALDVDDVRSAVAALRSDLRQRSAPTTRSPHSAARSTTRKAARAEQRRARELRRGILGLVVLLVFLLLITGGALQAGAEWFGQWYVERMSLR